MTQGCKAGTSLLAVVLAVVLLILDRGEALAQSGESQADFHFKLGVEHLHVGQLDAAIVAFEQAYALSPRAVVLFNLGQAYSLAGRPVSAVDALRRYLETAGLEAAPERRQQVEAALEMNERRIGTVKLEVRPSSAEVTVDGQSVTAGTTSLRLSAGRHGLFVSHPEYEPSGVPIDVITRTETTINIALTSRVSRQPAWLRVMCHMADVDIDIDGERVEQASLPLPLPPGIHRVRFSRRGYATREVSVALPPAALVSADCGLSRREPLPLMESAKLTVVPSETNAEVQVNGVKHDGSRLPFGRHVVKVSRAGFEPWIREVTLASTRERTLPAYLVPTPLYLHEYQRRASRQRLWGIVSGSTGAALGTLAAVLYIFNSDRAADWRADRRRLSAELASGSVTQQELAASYKLERTLVAIQRVDDIALASAVTGGALLAIGIGALVWGPDPDRYQRKLAAHQRGTRSALRKTRSP